MCCSIPSCRTTHEQAEQDLACTTLRVPAESCLMLLNRLYSLPTSKSRVAFMLPGVGGLNSTVSHGSLWQALHTSILGGLYQPGTHKMPEV